MVELLEWNCVLPYMQQPCRLPFWNMFFGQEDKARNILYRHEYKYMIIYVYLIYLFTMYVLTVLFLYWLGRFCLLILTAGLILFDSYTVKCKLNRIHSYQCFS